MLVVECKCANVQMCKPIQKPLLPIQYPEPITLAFPALPNLPFVNVQLFMLSKGAFMPTVYANYRLRTALFQAAFNLYEYVAYDEHCVVETCRLPYIAKPGSTPMYKHTVKRKCTCLTELACACKSLQTCFTRAPCRYPQTVSQGVPMCARVDCPYPCRCVWICLA